MSIQEIETDTNMDVIVKLQNLISSQLDHKKIAMSFSSQSEIIQQIYQNLMVQTLIGDKMAVQIFVAWYRARNSFVKEELTQQDLLQWISSKDINGEIFQYIITQYKKIFPAQGIHQDQPCEQIQIKEDSIIQEVDEYSDIISIKQQAMVSEISNSSNIFEVINVYASGKEQINEDSLPQQKVLFYTHEQMMNQLKFELQGTPSRTIGSKNYQLQQQWSIKQQHLIQNANYSSPQCLFNILQVEEYEFYNDETVIDDSEVYGHFLNGDKVEEILQIFYHRNQQYITVRWKDRSNGFHPKDSALLSEILKYHCPRLLISFYQERFPILLQ